MNYYKELNAFRDWKMFHDMPSSAILLWHSLMLLKNTTGGKSAFQAQNIVLQNLTGLSKQGVANAREHLVENGLITCQKGQIGKAAIYQILSLADTVDQKVDPILDQANTVDPTLDQLLDQANSVDPIVDRKLTVLKEREEEERRGESENNPVTIYQANFDGIKPIIKASLLDWSENLGDEIVIAGIKLAVKKGGRTFSYLEQILKEWAAANLETIEQVRGYERKKQTKPIWKETNKSRMSLFDELRREGVGT